MQSLLFTGSPYRKSWRSPFVICDAACVCARVSFALSLCVCVCFIHRFYRPIGMRRRAEKGVKTCVVIKRKNLSIYQNTNQGMKKKNKRIHRKMNEREWSIEGVIFWIFSLRYLISFILLVFDSIECDIFFLLFGTIEFFNVGHIRSPIADYNHISTP